MDDSLDYTLVRRKHQKYLRIRVNHDGTVRVSVPETMSRQDIQRSLAAKESWIRAHSDRFKSRFEALDPSGGVWFLGERRKVEIKPSVQGRRSVTFSETQNRFLLRCKGTSREEAEKALAAWFKRKARFILLPELEALSASTGLPFKKLYIRNQATRWGSSSSRGNISLNFRIIMAPQEVRRYLIIHELCHQRHFNHSSAYWAEVSRFCPEYRKAESWLKEQSLLLSLFR